MHHYLSLSGRFAGAMDELTEMFNRQKTPYQLTSLPVDHESFKNRILEEIRSGKAADVYTSWAGARTQAISDRLLPLDDVLPPQELADRFSLGLMRSAGSYNGQTKLIPLTQHYVGFFYNKAVFARLGLNPPENWHQLLGVASQLKAAGVIPFALGAKARWPAQFWFDYLLLRTAPLSYRHRLLSGRASWTDPEVARVFSLWNQLIQNGFFNSAPDRVEFDTGAARLVYQGEAAMTLMGSWLIGYLTGPQLQWREGEDFGFFSFPTIDPTLPPVALGPVDGLVIPKDSKNPEGAKAVLKHFVEPENQALLGRATGAISPNLKKGEGFESPLRRQIRAETIKAQAWAFNYDLATSPPAAEIGLQLFGDFLRAPSSYRRLLEEADQRFPKARMPENLPPTDSR